MCWVTNKGEADGQCGHEDDQKKIYRKLWEWRQRLENGTEIIRNLEEKGDRSPHNTHRLQCQESRLTPGIA